MWPLELQVRGDPAARAQGGALGARPPLEWGVFGERRGGKKDRSPLTFPQLGKWDLGFRGGVESRPGNTFVALPNATAESQLAPQA